MSHLEKIFIDGGVISYKDASAAQMNESTAGAAAGFTYAGSNAMRLNNSAATDAGSYTLADNLGTKNYKRLEMINGATSVARAITVDGDNRGSLLFDSTNATISAGVTLTGGSATLNATGAASTLTGGVTGGSSTALVKSGSAKLTLNSPPTYSGDTTIDAGTLALTSPNTSNDASTVTIASAAKLELAFDESGGPVTDTVKVLFIDVDQMPAGIYGATGSGAVHIDDTHFAGVGTLTVTSGGGGGTTYTLTYTPGSGGTISGTSPQTVSSGGSGTLVTAMPDANYHFVSWSDGILTAGRTDSPVTGNLSVTANFAIDSFTLDYTPGSGGTLSGTTPQTVNYGGSGSQVTAMPGTGYHFVTWSDGVLTAARTDSPVTANLSVSASFAVDTFTLNYTHGTGGTISGTTPQTVNYGGSGNQVTAMPATGYHFVSWNDGVLTAARTDSPVMANLSVSASFAVSSYALTYNGNGSTSGSLPAVSANHDYGTSITVLGNTGGLTKTGSTFAGWNTVATGIAGLGYVAGNSFSMPAGAVTLYAMWAPDNFLTEVKDNGGASTKELTLTCAVPADAVLVAGSGACSGAFNGVTYTVEAGTTLVPGSWTSQVNKFGMSYTYPGLPALPDGGYWKYQTFSAFEALGGKGFIRRVVQQP